MVSGSRPYYFGQQPAAQQVAGCGRRRMVEQAARRIPSACCGGDIGRAVIDKERLRQDRVRSGRAGSPVDFRLGFHHALLAGDHLAVEKPVDGKTAQEGDELARHVRKHVQACTRRPSGRRRAVRSASTGSCMSIDRQQSTSSHFRTRAGVDPGKDAGHLVERRCTPRS